MTPLTSPFTDWLSVTTPTDNAAALREAVRPLLDATAFSEDYADERAQVYRHLDGTVRMYAKHGVFITSISGDACHAFRTWDTWGPLLASLGSLPHRVTMLHATVEVAVCGSVLVPEIAARARSGAIQFTRKGITPQQVQTLLSDDKRGQLTGTCYLGARQADVQGVAYDKRHERERAGFVVGGPLTRFEMRLRAGTGVTLHDAFDPTRVFWHYAGRGLLSPPAPVLPWSPQAEGFTMPERPVFTAAELMARKLECSPDVRRLLELAAECGPHGIDLLCNRLRKLADQGTEPLGRPQGVDAVEPRNSGVH